MQQQFPSPPGAGAYYYPPQPQSFPAPYDAIQFATPLPTGPLLPQPPATGGSTSSFDGRSVRSVNSGTSSASAAAGTESIRVVVRIHTPAADARLMTFDRVFDPTASQRDVFDDCGAAALVDRALDGYATTLFAFGQTGSGKSYTVTGAKNEELSDSHAGLVLRSLRYMFERVAARPKVEYAIRASYLEIYNEHVQDLMSLTNTVSLPVRFQAGRGFFVENLLVLDCKGIEECVAVLQEGLRNRTTRAHQLNEYSSRSHSILTIHIDSTIPSDPGTTTDPIKRHGKISFVDLAGSEKARDSGATAAVAGKGGEAFHEMRNINKSLLTLGTCISALSNPRLRGGHIPYRDSNLTRLLADSLGGAGLALMIACVSPAARHCPETLKTLRYAQRTKRIRNRPVVVADKRDEIVDGLAREIATLRRENLYLRSCLGQGTPPTPSRPASSLTSRGGFSLPAIPGASPAPSSAGSLAAAAASAASESSVSRGFGDGVTSSQRHRPAVKSSPLGTGLHSSHPAGPKHGYVPDSSGGRRQRRTGTIAGSGARSAPDFKSSLHPEKTEIPDYSQVPPLAYTLGPGYGADPGSYQPALYGQPYAQPYPQYYVPPSPYPQQQPLYHPHAALVDPGVVAETNTRIARDVQNLDDALNTMRAGRKVG
ncbi:Kinesin- protein 12 [Geranomyces variabilis]|uniref:Kinesin-like protein n=1 Tax=Geranomyces variabilis TaxID=109894 RepID=A0AAD5XTW8_9FUNG|nr:Kinesin- protein 12 [Geranomyces variabilis]